MKTLAVLCNILLLGLIAAVTITEGLPEATAYRIFTLLLILVPFLTLLVLRRDPDGGWLRRAMAIANLALAGLIVWASIAQYPYPEGNGILIFAVLTLTAPLVSAWMLLRRDPPRKAVA